MLLVEEARRVDRRADLIRVDDNGTVRRSRSALVFAVLTRMRKIQVLSDDRPSNAWIPRITPSHVSWTTSSATAGRRT